MYRYIRHHHKCRWAVTEAKTLVKTLGTVSKPKRRTVHRYNELHSLVPESKPKILPVTGVYRHMQIGILEVKQHHLPTLVKTLKNGGEGLHAEFGNSNKRVETTQVENGVELTIALGGQEIIGVPPPPLLVPQYINRLHAPLDQERWNLFLQCLSFALGPGQWLLYMRMCQWGETKWRE